MNHRGHGNALRLGCGNPKLFGFRTKNCEKGSAGEECFVMQDQSSGTRTLCLKEKEQAVIKNDYKKGCRADQRAL